MSTRQANPLEDPDFYEAVRTQLIELFLQPELDRRQTPRAEFRQFAAILSPGGGVRVLIDEEVTWVAQARANRPIADGELVTTADFDAASITAIRPEAAGPDDGWAGLVDLPTQKMLVFNFHRNRGKARLHLERADEFYEVAVEALTGGRFGPATENLFAAAELAVMAGMLLIHDDPTRAHHKREEHFVVWAEHGNAPMSQANALKALRAARPQARYCDDAPALDGADLIELASEVRAIIDTTRARAIHPLDAQGGA